MAGEGLVSMTPTSISHTGTSATINADGGVDFSACSVISLNGVFTSAYTNYLVTLSVVQSSGDTNIQFKLRAAGSDATTNYDRQRLLVGGTTAAGELLTNQGAINAGTFGSSPRSGYQYHLYGPAIAADTAFRSISMNGESGARIFDVAGVHRTSTAYDGFTIEGTGVSATGNIHVFGYEE